VEKGLRSKANHFAVTATVRAELAISVQCGGHATD
jgi:hypothetical protein